MPSSVVIDSREALERNFVENGLNVFCQASFGAGAYAIGGTLLGFPPLTVPAALLTSAALLTALAVCPANGNQQDIFGVPPILKGGQCNAPYKLTLRFSDYGSDCALQAELVQDVFATGPLTFVDTTPKACTVPADSNRKLRVIDSFGVEVYSHTSFYGVSPGVPFTSVTRTDGFPDDCGNQGGSPGQVITNTTTGDTIDNSKVENNQNFFTVIPVVVNLGGVNGTLNLNFGGIKINSLFPLNFDIDVGGVRFRIGEEPDGSHKLKPVNPDKTLPSTDLEKEVEDLRKLIEQIKDCVCNPVIELEDLFMPFVDSSINCEIDTATLLVPKNSVSSSLYQKFQDTASLAVSQCEREKVIQLPEQLIFSATTTSNGHEIFTGEIDVEVISLRVKITQVNNPDLPIISLYPEANQRKFGSISYVLEEMQGGGDYVYVFDVDTYLPLPLRAKKGKLRVLFKAGISFEVYDTGERR